MSTFTHILQDQKDRAGATKYLTEYTVNTAQALVDSWWEMTWWLVAKFNDNFDNFPKLGQGIPFPTPYLDLVLAVDEHNSTCPWTSTLTYMQQYWWVTMVGGLVVGLVVGAMGPALYAGARARKGYQPIASE